MQQDLLNPEFCSWRSSTPRSQASWPASGRGDNRGRAKNNRAPGGQSATSEKRGRAGPAGREPEGGTEDHARENDASGSWLSCGDGGGHADARPAECRHFGLIPTTAHGVLSPRRSTKPGLPKLTFAVAAQGWESVFAPCGSGSNLPLRLWDGSYERRSRPWRSGSMRQCRPEPRHGKAGASGGRGDLPRRRGHGICLPMRTFRCSAGCGS